MTTRADAATGSEAHAGQPASRHRSVLAAEALAAWQDDPSGCYVDCTCGDGGHSAALLSRLSADGRLFAMDQDAAAVRATRRRLADDARCCVAHASFADLAAVCRAWGVHGQVHGMLFDLGVSSAQLDDPARGFSFRADGPLDMRMNPDAGASAADWLAVAGEDEIERALRDYGEERRARRVARAIVAARRRAPLRRTAQLSSVVAAALPSRRARRHPATRVFQAVRIQVNGELDALRAALSQCWAALAPRGRLVVISFHSLEDRIVKRFIRSGAVDAEADERAGARRWQALGRQTRPGADERRRNPRSRSAVMRAAIKRDANARADLERFGAELAC